MLSLLLAIMLIVSLLCPGPVQDFAEEQTYGHLDKSTYQEDPNEDKFDEADALGESVEVTRVQIAVITAIGLEFVPCVPRTLLIEADEQGYGNEAQQVEQGQGEVGNEDDFSDSHRSPATAYEGEARHHKATAA